MDSTSFAYYRPFIPPKQRTHYVSKRLHKTFICITKKEIQIVKYRKTSQQQGIRRYTTIIDTTLWTEVRRSAKKRSRNLGKFLKASIPLALSRKPVSTPRHASITNVSTG